MRVVRSPLLVLVVIGSIVAPSVCCAAEWSMMTRDFHSRPVTLSGVDESGVSIVGSSTIAFSDFLSLNRVNTAAASGARFTVRLRDGNDIAGDPVVIDGDNLRWRSPVIGPVSFPMSNVAEISTRRREGVAGLSLAKSPSDDQATLKNADVVHGVVAEISPKSISMQRADGGIVPIALETLDSLRFAAVSGNSSTAATRDGVLFAIELNDGSKLSVDHLSIHPPNVEFAMHDGVRRQIQVNDVRSIEQLNGPVTWLSGKPPLEKVQTPLFDRALPARFDRSVFGRPIKFGDQMFAHGIGVHAYSRLSWPVDAADRAFRTQFAIDGDAPYADVTVRIKLDGQVVTETRDVRGGVLSPVVVVDVGNAHTLTLEVEDASNDNVQARLNWIEPALLKFRPTTNNSIAMPP